MQPAQRINRFPGGLHYAIDANGYLHFVTEYAGDIVVSVGQLRSRSAASGIASSNPTDPSSTEVTLTVSATETLAAHKLVELSVISSDAMPISPIAYVTEPAEQLQGVGLDDADRPHPCDCAVDSDIQKSGYDARPAMTQLAVCSQ
jgi:hypothetical protein